MPLLRHPAVVCAELTNLPAGLRVPLGWPLAELAPGRPVALRWPGVPQTSAAGGWLRITTGINDNEIRPVVVKLAVSGEQVGVFDLRLAHALEPFQVKFDPEVWARVVGEGVTLTVDSSCKRPLWLLGADSPVAAHRPHLLVDDADADRLAGFFASLGSLASLQPFGWMDGCVPDALQDLAESGCDECWSTARDEHLAAYFKPDGALVYEDPGSRPADSQIHCIEETLPFAVLAKVNREDPRLDIALNLAGAAQSNRGGEALQRSDYRVLSPMGMGLMGQLAAAVTR